MLNTDNKHEEKQPASLVAETPSSSDQIEDVENPHEGCPTLWPQLLAAGSTSLVQLITGCIFAFTGVILPMLINPESDDLILDKAQASLFGSIVNAGYVISALFSGVGMTWFGQRMMILTSLPTAAIGWLMIGFSPSFGFLLAGRFVHGISAGLISPCTYNYLVELTHPSARGTLVSMNDLFRQIGIIVIIAIGSLNLTWRQVCFIQLAFILPPLLILLYIPDSPRWLALRGKTSEGHKALTFYRGSKYDVDKEYKDICEQIEESSAKRMNVNSQLQLIRTREILPIFLLTTFMMVAFHFGGNMSFITYSVVIFQSAKVDINPYMSAMVASSTRIIGVITFVFIAHKVKRKSVYCVSLGVAGSSLIIVAIFFYIQMYNDVSSLSWLPLVSFMVYSYSTSLYVPVLFLLRGELLPNSIRPVATGIHFCLLSVAMFVTTFSYPYMADYLGLHWTFAFYGICSFITLAVVVCFLPETRGKTLEQIGDMHKKPRTEA